MLEHSAYPYLMIQELQTLQACSHPNIIRVIELLEDSDNYFIVTEVLEGGELFDKLISRLQKSYTFSEKEVSIIIKQVLLAINYMHQQNIMHRDLKPQNLLLENEGSLEIKVADFGFSRFFNPQQSVTLELGTADFKAPELFRG